MRRRAPRPVGAILEPATAALAPIGLLARVHGSWAEVAGPVLAAEAEPVAERGGVVTVSCRSAAWAQELALLSDDLLERLNCVLDPAGGRPPVAALRFTSARPARRS